MNTWKEASKDLEIPTIRILTAYNPAYYSLLKKKWEQAYKNKYNKRILIELYKPDSIQGGFQLAKKDLKKGFPLFDIALGGGEKLFKEYRDLLLSLPHSNSAITFEDRSLALCLEELEHQSNHSVALRDKKNKFFASAYSQSVLLVNQKLLQQEKIPIPTQLSELADPIYYNQLVLADFRKSTAAAKLPTLLLKRYGWEKGYTKLIGMAANSVALESGTSNTIDNLKRRNVLIAPTLYFYAQPEAEASTDFAVIQFDSNDPILQQETINIDPIAISINSRYPIIAKELMQLFLEEEMQQLLADKLYRLPLLNYLENQASNPEEKAIPNFISSSRTTEELISWKEEEKMLIPIFLHNALLEVTVHKQLKKLWGKIHTLPKERKKKILEELSHPIFTLEELKAEYLKDNYSHINFIKKEQFAKYIRSQVIKHYQQLEQRCSSL